MNKHASVSILIEWKNGKTWDKREIIHFLEKKGKSNADLFQVANRFTHVNRVELK